MAKTRKPREVERRIYFFRADTGTDANGDVIPLDLSETLQAVEQVPFKSDSKRYWQQRDGDAIGLWTNEHGYDRFVLATVRRSSLPQAELDGNLTDLELSAGAGLHEPVHVRVYPDNLFGIEFNFYGPRPSRLPAYLKHVIPAAPDFTMEALLRQDAQAQLDHHREMRLLDLHVRPSYSNQIKEASKSLGDAFDAMGKVSQAEVVGLTLRPEPNKRSSLGKSVLDAARRIARQPGLAENAVRFKAKGVNETTGRVETVDLLQDQLVSYRRILTIGPRSRTVESQAAFEAIDLAYNELKPQLLDAAGVSVVQTDGS